MDISEVHHLNYMFPCRLLFLFNAAVLEEPKYL